LTILEKCYSEKVTTLKQYIDRKKEHTKKADEYKRQLKAKKPEHEVFDRREYAENELEKYYVNVAD
jgi:hypothetical protein